MPQRYGKSLIRSIHHRADVVMDNDGGNAHYITIVIHVSLLRCVNFFYKFDDEFLNSTSVIELLRFKFLQPSVSVNHMHVSKVLFLKFNFHSLISC